MVGVSGPMVRQSSARALRFGMGLAIAFIIASLFVALLLGALSQLILAAPLEGRSIVCSVILAGLAAADVSGHTPYMVRQVPQRMIHTLPPGLRGIAWGFDLGLLVTTQKATSLIWGALAGAVLFAGPNGVVSVVLAIAIAYLGGTAATLIVPAWRQRMLPRSPLAGASFVRSSQLAASAVLLVAAFSVTGVSF